MTPYINAIPEWVDLSYFGKYRIRGTVDRLGERGLFRVQLRLKDTMALIRGAVSDPSTGEYIIPYLPNAPSAFVLIAQDRDYRFTSSPLVSAYSDQVTMEPMP